MDIVEKIKETNAQLIDVRTVMEYRSGHAEGAVNVELDKIISGNCDEIEKSRPIYVYCRSGSRSGYAKMALEQMGYGDVNDLGGLHDLARHGFRMIG